MAMPRQIPKKFYKIGIIKSHTIFDKRGQGLDNRYTNSITKYIKFDPFKIDIQSFQYLDEDLISFGLSELVFFDPFPIKNYNPEVPVFARSIFPFSSDIIDREYLSQLSLIEFEFYLKKCEKINAIAFDVLLEKLDSILNQFNPLVFVTQILVEDYWNHVPKYGGDHRFYGGLLCNKNSLLEDYFFTEYLETIISGFSKQTYYDFGNTVQGAQSDYLEQREKDLYEAIKMQHRVREDFINQFSLDLYKDSARKKVEFVKDKLTK